MRSRAKILQDRADAPHLVGVRFGELALADEQRILEADPDIAAHDRAHGDQRQLVAAGGEDRPAVLLAEQLVGDMLGMREILGIGADAAEDAEDALHEERRLDQLAVEEMGEGVEMADVVALELEARAMRLAEMLQDVFDVLEGVAEDEVARVLEMDTLPIVLELLVLGQHGVEAEIHRAHVERAHLGRGPKRRRQPLLERHAVAAAGGDVDHRVGGLLDPRQELHEHLRIRRRPAVPRVARVQMQDRRARLRCLDRLLRHRVWGERQIGAHRRGVDRPRDGAGDDDLPGLGHGLSSTRFSSTAGVI